MKKVRSGLVAVFSIACMYFIGMACAVAYLVLTIVGLANGFRD